MIHLPENILSIRDFSSDQVHALLENCSENFAPIRSTDKWALLFLEPSTRTRASFQIAAQDLNFNPVIFEGTGSSLEKGESLNDTLENLWALGVNRFVIRQKTQGLLPELTDPRWRIINAGDGTGEHPTQALLDALTLKRKFNRLDGVKLLIMGDLLHSRVAHSWIYLAPLLGIELYLSSPEALKPGQNVTHWSPDPEEFLKKMDVVMTVRIQKERFNTQAELQTQFEAIEKKYQLKKDSLNSNQRFMAPGPVYWNSEIEGSLKEDSRSLILDQVKMGRVLRRTMMLSMSSVG